MYRLIQNNTDRTMPAKTMTEGVLRLPRRIFRESIQFEDGGETALVLDVNGETLALYRYSDRAGG